MEAFKSSVTSLVETAPLTLCITNYVSMDIMANVLLAIRASPAMLHAPEESADFTKISGALSINMGTLGREPVQGMKNAIEAANEKGIPWVLDPVGMGATPYRSQCTKEIAEMKPTAIRGNASEIMALCAAIVGTTGVAGKGVDSTHTTDAALDDAMTLASRLGSIVVCTGEKDYVTDGTRVIAVENGDVLMTKVTAVGCALSSVIAAFLASCPGDKVMAAAHATAFYNCAGDIAAEGNPGPGTFRVRFMDALYDLTAPERAALLEKCWTKNGTRIVKEL